MAYPKILNVSQQDFANFQFDNMNALRSVGLHCDSVVMESHPFYKEQSPRSFNLSSLIGEIEDYDIIQFFHDNTNLYNTIKPAIISKKIIAYHTSSAYRRSHVAINHAMANADIHVAAMPEFVAMCPKSIYMVGAVDTDRLKPGGWENTGRPVFAHYPSNSTVKGTSNILQLMKESPTTAKLEWSTDIVGYEKQLERMNQCDIYIEMFTEKDGMGSNYGDFGITALEAAALGKAVITNCKHETLYGKHYGRSFFHAANSKTKFRQLICSFNAHRSLVNEASASARELVVKNHSYKATGEYFLKHILKP